MTENTALPPHLAVWIDHHHARLIWVYRDRAVETVVHNPDAGGQGHVHHHSGTQGSGHAPLPKPFLEKVCQAIGAAEEILLLGPVEARHALRRFMDEHNPAQARHVMGEEALASGQTAEMAAHARRFFLQADRMAQRRP